MIAQASQQQRASQQDRNEASKSRRKSPAGMSGATTRMSAELARVDKSPTTKVPDSGSRAAAAPSTHEQPQPQLAANSMHKGTTAAAPLARKQLQPKLTVDSTRTGTVAAAPLAQDKLQLQVAAGSMRKGTTAAASAQQKLQPKLTADSMPIGAVAAAPLAKQQPQLTADSIRTGTIAAATLGKEQPQSASRSSGINGERNGGTQHKGAVGQDAGAPLEVDHIVFDWAVVDAKLRGRSVSFTEKSMLQTKRSAEAMVQPSAPLHEMMQRKSSSRSLTMFSVTRVPLVEQTVFDVLCTVASHGSNGQLANCWCTALDHIRQASDKCQLLDAAGKNVSRLLCKKWLARRLRVRST